MRSATKWGTLRSSPLCPAGLCPDKKKTVDSQEQPLITNWGKNGTHMVMSRWRQYSISLSKVIRTEETSRQLLLRAKWDRRLSEEHWDQLPWGLTGTTSYDRLQKEGNSHGLFGRITLASVFPKPLESRKSFQNSCWVQNEIDDRVRNTKITSLVPRRCVVRSTSLCAHRNNTVMSRWRQYITSISKTISIEKTSLQLPLGAK